MKKLIRQLVEDYYRTIKDSRPNYKACYDSFLDYCEKELLIYSANDMVNSITKKEIENACKYYFRISKKATSIESIKRFLTAIDQFYKYIRMKGIILEELEEGCRSKQIVQNICQDLNQELNHQNYLPFDGKEELKLVEEQLKLLNKNNFYQFGQSIIYRLLIIYGLKEKIVINFKLHDFDRENGKLLVNYNGEDSIYINLLRDIYEDLVEYCDLNKYKDRVYLFTKSNGTLLTPNSMLGTLKNRLKKMDITNFTPTTVALFGVEKLIKRGMTISEIKLLTGFETQIIDNVSDYLLKNEDVEQVINKKLS